MSIYIYPNSKNIPVESRNPYIGDLIRSLSKHEKVVNRDSPTSLGLIDLLIRLPRTRVVIFSWIENVVDKKGGMLQFFLFYLICFLCRVSGKKIVFILHNKFSHSKSRLFLKKRLFRSVISFSSQILTHSGEGIRFIQEKYPSAEKKVFFLHHPVGSNEIKKGPDEKKMDLLLWGTMSRYKGVDRFIEYATRAGIDRNHRILIAGKFNPEEFFREIEPVKGEIRIRNEYVPDDELEDLILSSKYILFTYIANSVLSSGALMKSLEYESMIIAPCTGAFRDLANEKIILCYSSIDQLDELLNSISDKTIEEMNRNKLVFLQENSWEKFSARFIEKIRN